MKNRILVVDDLDLWRDILKDVLEVEYEVDTAASLEEALHLLKQGEPYQVVVTDIGLSDDETNTDGIDVLKAVARHSPETQTIAVSGRAAIADKERFQQEYRALVYLERDFLADHMDEFLQWVSKGVALALSRSS